MNTQTADLSSQQVSPCYCVHGRHSPPVGSILHLVNVEQVAREIEAIKRQNMAVEIDFINARAGKPRLKAQPKRRHDLVRLATESIFQDTLNNLLEWLQPQIISNLKPSENAKAKNNSLDTFIRAISVMDEKTEEKLRKAFEAKFMADMAEAEEKAYIVSSRGLITNLRQDEKLTSSGIVKKFVFNRKNKIKDCPDNIFQQIQNSLTKGDKAGETMDELSARVRKTFKEISTGRAKVIAQTESQCAYGTSQYNVLENIGFKTKRWQTSVDELVRPSHTECEEQESIPLGESFANGLMYPGDPDGEPEEVIGCRCYLTHGDAAEDMA